MHLNRALSNKSSPGSDISGTDNTEVPIVMWHFKDYDTIRVTFNLPGVDGISSSGYLTNMINELWDILCLMGNVCKIYYI